MRVALVDNGSLEPAAHEKLRAAADAVGRKAGVEVEAVSWRHSGRIPASALGGKPAWTLANWIKARTLEGEREFLLVPFFISAQGAIGSSLGRDLESLRSETPGFEYALTGGLTPDDVLPRIVCDRIRQASAAKGLVRPNIIVVDHGGPSRSSSEVRNRVADAVARELGASIGTLSAASMESPRGPGFEFNRPLLAEALGARGFDRGDVLIAPLFLLPGRHAGPGGDLERIARGAEALAPGLRCHFTELVGSHPLAIEALAGALAVALQAEILP